MGGASASAAVLFLTRLLHNWEFRAQEMAIWWLSFRRLNTVLWAGALLYTSREGGSINPQYPSVSLSRVQKVDASNDDILMQGQCPTMILQFAPRSTNFFMSTTSQGSRLYPHPSIFVLSLLNDVCVFEMAWGGKTSHLWFQLALDYRWCTLWWYVGNINPLTWIVCASHCSLFVLEKANIYISC